MNPPATMKKMLMTAPFVLGAIAFVSFELPHSAVLGQQNQPTSAEPTSAEPTLAELTSAEPTLAEPTLAEPTLAELTSAEPKVAEPASAELTSAEPTSAELTSAEPTSAELTSAEPTSAEPASAEPASAEPKADGLFLYGEAPQPKQTSKGYVVFQRQQGKVVGATYFPNSEFECFTGSEKNNTLDVKSVGVGEPQIAATKINLSNLHQIKLISADEQRLISVCKQETASPTNK